MAQRKKYHRSHRIAIEKLYRNNDWVWVQVNLRAQDIKYLNRYWKHCKASAPTLEKRQHKYYFRFAFAEQVSLSKIPVSKQRICSVDLGYNSDAVCSIMQSDGTVLARKFVDFASEKDQLKHTLNKIKKQQRKNGSKSTRALWEYAKHYNNEIAIKVANAITEFAVLYSVDTVVFEHLDFRGKKYKGGKAQRLAIWKKNSIQDFVEHALIRQKTLPLRSCCKRPHRKSYVGLSPPMRA